MRMKIWIVVTCLSCLAPVIADDNGNQYTLGATKIVMRDEGDRHELYRRQVDKYVEVLKSQGQLNPTQAAMVVRALHSLHDIGLHGKLPTERKKKVRSVIGEEAYEALLKYSNQLLESDKTDQSSQITALMILGEGLVNRSSVPRVKQYVFSEDEDTQYKAILNLVYLGEKSMEKLLRNFILSGNLAPQSTLSALTALESVGSNELDSCALWIARHEQNDPFLVRKALEFIEGNASHLSAVEMLFLSNRFPPSMDPVCGELAGKRNMLNFYLLGIMFDRWLDVANKSTVLERARSLLGNPHADIYMYASMIVAAHGTTEDKDRIEDVIRATADETKKKFIQKLIPSGAAGEKLK